MRFLFLPFVLFIITAVPLSAGSPGDSDEYAPMKYEGTEITEDMRISRGGQLYDNWWRTSDKTKKPDDDHLLWNRQSTNKRDGYSTWRCKECHGWDYRGSDGVYGTGSHFTGFQGVYKASGMMTLKELDASLRGSTNKDHDFTGHLNDDDISDLALFLKKGIVDLVAFINTDGLSLNGDGESGQILFTKNCMTECHGPDGTAINFGNNEKPEYIGTLAVKNPWEFIHKVRAGQPGTRMSSGIINRWDDRDMRNLLAYAQTLPKKQREKSWFDRVLTAVGLGGKNQESHVPHEHRGFGPKLEQ